MLKESLLIALIAVVITMPAMAVAPTPAAITAYIPNAQQVGSGRLSYMIWPVYDAFLYAAKGKYQPNQPVALDLRYLRSIKGKEIADISAQEIRKQGFNDEVTLAAWHDAMCRIFPDVKEGTILTGIALKNGDTVFLQGDKKIGSIRDRQFSHYFFAIWLGAGTGAPKLRQELLGLL